MVESRPRAMRSQHKPGTACDTREQNSYTRLLGHVRDVKNQTKVSIMREFMH